MNLPVTSELVHVLAGNVLSDQLINMDLRQSALNLAAMHGRRPHWTSQQLRELRCESCQTLERVRCTDR